MKRKTFSEARAAILAHLVTLSGWDVHTRSAGGVRDLKVPWATTPEGSRVEFHAQSIYLGAHSTGLDIRSVTPEGFVGVIEGLESR